MKLSEMNGNQKQVYRMVIDACNEYVGGWENAMEDSSEGSEEWLEAKAQLEAGHDTLVSRVLCEVRNSTEWKRLEHLHFVTIEWTKERVNKRLAKMGY